MELATKLNQLDKKELLAVKQELERERVKNDLMYLCSEYLGYEDLNLVLHGKVVSELEQMKDNLIVLMPRGHLKSSLVTIGWTIQQVLKNQNIRICILNAGFNKALEFLGEIKLHLESLRLIELFPDILYVNPKQDSGTWREDRIIVKRTKIVPGYTVRVNSIKGTMTGEHYDVIIFDDIVDLENVQTIIERKKNKKRYKNCRSILEPKGLRIVIGTRWLKEDIYGWLEKFEYKTILRKAVEGGKVIFPEKFDLKKLEEIKFEIGSYEYSCQYNNEPLAEEDITFKEEWIKYYERIPTDGFVKYYILIDPALSRGKWGTAESVICVVGKPKTANLPLHVIKSTGYSVKAQPLINQIFVDYKWFSEKADTLIGIEIVAFQDILKQWIEKQQLSTKLFFTVTELRPGPRRKERRIQALQPLLENEGVVFHQGYTEELVQQLLDVGSSEKMDHADAFAYLLDVIDVDVDVGCMDMMDVTAGYDENSLEAQIALQEGYYGGELSWRDY